MTTPRDFVKQDSTLTLQLVLELNGLYALVRNVRTDLDVVMTVLEKVNHASEEELAHQRGFLARLDAALAAKEDT